MRVLGSGHTYPVLVTVAGKPIRASRRSGEWLRKCVDVLWNERHRLIRESERPAAAEAYDHARRTYDRIIAESEIFSVHQKNLAARPRDFGADFLSRVLPSVLFTANDYVQATREHRRMMIEMEPLLARFDAFVTAAEATLDLWRAGARVTLVHFGPTFDKKIKPWVLPDVENAAVRREHRRIFLREVRLNGHAGRL